MNEQIIFWQNIISPHQTDFLKELSNIYNIILVVENEQDELRKNDKWEIPDTQFLNILINPTEEKLKKLFKIKNTIHIFSGINSYEIIQKGFILAIQNDAKIGILSEPLDWTGIKGKLRLIKSKIDKIRYNKKIDFILTIGEKGRWWYEKVGYPTKKIYDFGYFVNGKFFKNISNTNNKIIYVGRINENKGVFDLIDISLKYIDEFDLLEIYGRGNLEDKLNKLLTLNKTKGKIIYKGLINNDTVIQKLKESSLLVLPSKGKDGWGVVVNESLLVGTPVLISDNVGSCSLIRNSGRGNVFKANNLGDFEVKFKNMISQNLSQNKRNEIKEWCSETISPVVAVNYFKDIIDYTYNNSVQRPIAPWQKERL